MRGEMRKARLFGEFSRLGLYDRLVTAADVASPGGLRLIRAGDETPGPSNGALEQDLTGSLLREMWLLPILDHWRGSMNRGGFFEAVAMITIPPHGKSPVKG